MTVKDLMEALQGFDENAEVMFNYNYGDHCRTIVAEPVEFVESRDVYWSDYHNLHAVADDEYEGDKETREVVMLVS